MLWGSSGTHTLVQFPFLEALPPSDGLMVTPIPAAPGLLPLSNNWFPWEAHNISWFWILPDLCSNQRNDISASSSSSTAAEELCVPSPRTPPHPLPLVSLHFLPRIMPISSTSISKLRLLLCSFLSPVCYWRLERWWKWDTQRHFSSPALCPESLLQCLFVNLFSCC